MDKQQLIAYIETQLASGVISKGDLLNLSGVSSMPQNAFTPAPIEATPVKEETSRDLTHTFYGIGAIIAIVGVGILVAQNWEAIGFPGRIMVTLGIAVITYIAGLLLKNDDQKAVSQVMFTIAAALAPLGSYVFLKQAYIEFSWVTQLMTAIVLVVLFGGAFLISRRTILVLITVGYATWAYYAFIMNMFDFSFSADVLKWAAMLLGASYILIGYGCNSLLTSADPQDEKEKQATQSVLYGFGTLAILGAGIFVGGAFDLLFIALIFGAFYGSVYLKSRGMLAFGALFLMAHIIKLTSKYFVDSIGWPVALIAIGFLVIGVGYATLYLNKKFISNK